MGAPAAPLAVLEIAVRGRGAALARVQPVGIHPDAQRTSRLATVEAGVAENPVEPLLLGLPPDAHRPGNDPRAGVTRTLSSARHRSRGLQIIDTAVGAAAAEHPV